MTTHPAGWQRSWRAKSPIPVTVPVVLHGYVCKQENSRPATSRLARPKTAAAILQNKSTALNAGKLDESVAQLYKDEDLKEVEVLCDRFSCVCAALPRPDSRP